MESTGPMTRSRAKSGAAVGTSAAPSTRKRAATRSTRKCAAAAKDLLGAEPDDTATRTDVPESAEEQPISTSSDPSLAHHEGVEMPATVLADPQSVSFTIGTAAIAGLTPVSTVVTPGLLPSATPCIMGPSPIQPIQLESLLSPPPENADSRPFSAGGSAAGPSPNEVGTDLAAMFISTPAVAGDAASPVEGLVAEAPAGAPASPEQQAFAEQPFGGFAEAAAAAEPQPEADMQEPAPQQVDADDAEPVGFGSPAPLAAVDDGVVTELEDAAPSAPPLPLSPKPASSPAPAAANSTTPSGSCRVLRSSARSPAPIAAIAAASPVPMPSPGLEDDDDDDLPPADEAYPEEALLRQEAKAAGLLPPSPVPATCSMAADSKQEQEATPAGEDETECLSAAVQECSTAAVPADADMATEEYSEELLLPPTEDDEELLSDAEEAELAGMQAELDAQAAAMAAQQEANEQATADEHDADAMECADEDTAAAPAEDDITAAAAAAAEDDNTAAAPAEDDNTEAAEDDLAMLCGDSRADEEPAVVICPTPDPKAAPAAADLSVMSPEVVALPMVTSPSRTAGAATTTTAPPKSAMAKPKAAGAPSGRKSAHVVVPGPSPRSSHKTAAGSSSSSQCSTGNVDDNSSPGHTPYPSKAKVKAATAAATRSSMAAAAKGPGISHKKDIALACADSALKKYANSATAEQQHSGSTGVPSKKASSPSVGSRLLQPTASFMAKARASATPEADPYVWSPPDAETSSAAAPAAPKPRLASKVVVPSPPPAHTAAEPSLRSLKRTIKEKTAAKAAAKAEATVAEHRSRDAADKVHDVQQMRGSKPKAPKVKAPPAEEAELDFDEDDYEEQAYDQDADALADSLAGMRVGQLRVGRPAGPLKGVAAPAGKHLVFDEEGKAKETPASKLRQAPRHTYFDEEGRPVEAAAARPVWR